MTRPLPYLFVALLIGCEALLPPTTVDLCPSDPMKIESGACGCGVSDADANRNGVPDCFDAKFDLCPDDEAKTQPGTCGCGVSDADSNANEVPDCLDARVDFCPDDAAKTEAGTCGCGTSDADTDLNGAPDCLDAKIDLCPNDLLKTQAGTCGCGTSDADTNDNGVPDCLDAKIDLCPDDALKTVPGACGCGVADLDANRNGAPDCLDAGIDLCPDDPKKTVPGACGCEVADVDANRDGLPDCLDTALDLCPDDPDKRLPGVCGCGVSDRDANVDALPDCFEVNECELGTDNCAAEATCIDTPRAFRCACPAGYANPDGDGTRCTPCPSSSDQFLDTCNPATISQCTTGLATREGQAIAQGFTAGRSGLLATVRARVANALEDNGFVIEMSLVDGGPAIDTPPPAPSAIESSRLAVATIKATATLDWQEFVFSPAPPVQAGHRYHLFMRAVEIDKKLDCTGDMMMGPYDCYEAQRWGLYNDWTHGTEIYAGGRAFGWVSTTSTWITQPAHRAMEFETIVREELCQ